MSWTTKHVYNAQWRKVRKLVLERDGYVCQIRGPKCTGLATTVDHIIGWRWGGPKYDPENLRAACSACNSGSTWKPNVRRHPSQEW